MKTTLRSKYPSDTRFVEKDEPSNLKGPKNHPVDLRIDTQAEPTSIDFGQHAKNVMKHFQLSPVARKEYEGQSSDEDVKSQDPQDKIKQDLDSLKRLFRESARKGDNTIKKLASK